MKESGSAEKGTASSERGTGGAATGPGNDVTRAGGGANDAERAAAPRGPVPAGRERGRAGRRRSRRGLLGFVLALLTLAVAAGLFVLWGLGAPERSARAVEFEVLPGWGGSRVAAELERAGLIRNAELFRLYLRLRDLDRTIGEGLYDLDPSRPATATAETLAAGGRPRVARVVIPEGFRAVDVARRLESAGLGSAEEYLALIAEPGDLRRPFMAAGDGLEGYLFPASYDVPVRAEPPEVLAMFLQRFEQELDEGTLAGLEDSGLPLRDWVILASLVQSEAGDDSEMPVIAGVFLNRLDRGMPLQSDPTVAYGLGKDLPELSATAGDLRQDHPWNTYTRGGLPAGPISNPGSEALRAVLAPVRTTEAGVPYLYFLHGFDGDQRVFRPNPGLDEHNRDVRRYLRGQ